MVEDRYVVNTQKKDVQGTTTRMAGTTGQRARHLQTNMGKGGLRECLLLPKPTL